MLKAIMINVSGNEKIGDGPNCDKGCDYLSSDCDGFHCRLFCEKLDHDGDGYDCEAVRCDLCQDAKLLKTDLELSHILNLSKENESLQSANAKLQEENATLKTYYDEAVVRANDSRAEVEKLQSSLSLATGLLEEIENHEHCKSGNLCLYHNGKRETKSLTINSDRAYGARTAHRCAAAIAARFKGGKSKASK